MSLKRDFVVDVTVIRAWHCTLFLEDTKFLLVNKSLCLICVFVTKHLQGDIRLSASLLELQRQVRFVTSLPNNSRSMCQNETKAAEKNYQRTCTSVVGIIIGVSAIQDVFKVIMKNADFATSRPTIFSTPQLPLLRNSYQRPLQDILLETRNKKNLST